MNGTENLDLTIACYKIVDDRSTRNIVYNDSCDQLCSRQRRSRNVFCLHRECTLHLRIFGKQSQIDEAYKRIMSRGINLAPRGLVQHEHNHYTYHFDTKILECKDELEKLSDAGVVNETDIIERVLLPIIIQNDGAAAQDTGSFKYLTLLNKQAEVEKNGIRNC